MNVIGDLLVGWDGLIHPSPDPLAEQGLDRDLVGQEADRAQARHDRDYGPAQQLVLARDGEWAEALEWRAFWTADLHGIMEQERSLEDH